MQNDVCEDGLPGAESALCPAGTDCTDCGRRGDDCSPPPPPRARETSPPPPPPAPPSPLPPVEVSFFLTTEFIIIVVAAAVVVVLLIVAYLLQNPNRANACLSLVNSVGGIVRGVRASPDETTGKTGESTRDTINAVLDAAKRIQTESSNAATTVTDAVEKATTAVTDAVELVPKRSATTGRSES